MLAAALVAGSGMVGGNADMTGVKRATDTGSVGHRLDRQFIQIARSGLLV
jgi:hypothetical protein